MGTFRPYPRRNPRRMTLNRRTTLPCPVMRSFKRLPSPHPHHSSRVKHCHKTDKSNHWISQQCHSLSRLSPCQGRHRRWHRQQKSNLTHGFPSLKPTKSLFIHQKRSFLNLTYTSI